MTQDDESRDKPAGAPGEQKEDEIPPSKPKGRFGAGGPPWNQKGLRHGAYSPRLSPEEERERDHLENDLIADLGGDVSTAQKVLIRRISLIEIRLRRCERADKKRLRIPDEHILAWINSQRLLLVALGLERKQKPGPDLQGYLAQREREKQQQEKVQ